MIINQSNCLFNFNQKFNLSKEHAVELINTAYEITSEMNIVRRDLKHYDIYDSKDEDFYLLRRTHHKLTNEFAFNIKTSEITDLKLNKYNNDEINTYDFNRQFKVDLIKYKNIRKILFLYINKKINDSEFENQLINCSESLIQKNIFNLYKKYIEQFLNNDVQNFVYKNKLRFISNDLFMLLPKDFRTNVMKEKINSRTVTGHKKQIHIPEFCNEPVFIKEVLFSDINAWLKGNYLSEHADLSFMDKNFVETNFILLQDIRRKSYLFDKLASTYSVLDNVK